MIHNIARRNRPAGRIDTKHNRLDTPVRRRLVQLLDEQTHWIIALSHKSALALVNKQTVNINDSYLITDKYTFISLYFRLSKLLVSGHELYSKRRRPAAG
jgi:hypothetical protein